MTYHVFLSHNSKDKPTVKRLGAELQKRGLRVWLDEWELRPGLTWQDALEDIIRTCGSAAVCVGSSGIGPWEDPEMTALLRRFIDEKKAGNILPVIPVLLPGAPENIKLPMLLEAFTWVDLRGGLTREGLDRLQWGITGVKSENNNGQTTVASQTISLSQLPGAVAVETESEKLDFMSSDEADQEVAGEAEPSKPNTKAAFVAHELVQTVCDQLNSDLEPFRSLRAQLVRRIAEETKDDSETNVEFLVKALTEKLNDVMSTLRVWLASTDRMDEGEAVRRLVDAVGTAGFDATWIEHLLAELEEGHLHVPIETDLNLCEVIFTALYRKPATWIRDKEIDHGAIGAIATPSTKPEQRAREIRRRLVQTYFKDRINREVGESAADYEKRLDDWAQRDLPEVLEVEREDQEPWFVLFLKTVDAVKKDMDIDPSLWSRIVKLEKSVQGDRVVYDRAKLQSRLTKIYGLLDQLDAKARKGPSL